MTVPVIATGPLTCVTLGRFWRSIATFTSLDDCWEWAATRGEGGYGRFWSEGHYWTAHRLTWEMANGPIPDGLQLDHLCRNRACVNPRHLEAVTPEENTHRGVGPSALNATKTHCVHGHQFSEANTAVLASGSRRCRTCHMLYVRAYRERKAVA